MIDETTWSNLEKDTVMSRLQTLDFGRPTSSHPTSSPPASMVISDARMLSAIRSLTPRQRNVLDVMMEGKSNKAICRILKIAEPTVKNHITAILKALNAANRTEAVLKIARASPVLMSYTFSTSSYSSSPGHWPPAVRVANST